MARPSISSKLALWLVATVCSVTELPGQFQLQHANMPADIFLMAPRPLQRLLAEGRQAIAQARYADGVTALGALLQDGSDTIPADLHGQDFFFQTAGTGIGNALGDEPDPAAQRIIARSVKSEAIRLLNELPAEGRQVLEIQFGVQARHQLDQAIAKRDMQQVAKVARHFVHTQAGYDAWVLLAQVNLTNGHPLAAAHILQTLLDYPAARTRIGVGLVEAASVCWLHAGRRDRATAIIKSAAKLFPGESLTVDGQQIAIEQSEQLLNLFQANTVDRNIDRQAQAWLVSGGSPARNATNEIGLPLPNEHWSWAIHSSRPEGLALQEAEESERKNGRQLLPKIELRTLDDLVISRSNDSTIIGIDLTTGLLKWQPPAAGSVAPLRGPIWESGDNQLSNELKNRIWGSTAFGRISCDQQHCYHVIHQRSEVTSPRGFNSGPRQTTATRMQAISIAREGSIVWSIGGADSDEPLLRSAYFLGPPLPYAGELYCLIEINGQIELVVLAPETGKLLWRQQLASTIQQIDFDPLRQAQGLMPSIADGIVVCPTGVGGVVAIDLTSRSLRWGITYQQITSMNRNGLGLPGGGFNMAGYDPLENRWYDESLLIERGVVVLTPPESDALLCVDLLTGEELLRRVRAGACYVAGIHGNNLILVNWRSVQAIDLAQTTNPQPRRDRNTGRSDNLPVRWELPFPDARTLTGKGIWQTDRLMLPLTGGQVIQVNLETGQLAQSANVTRSLGNLHAHRGFLLSVDPTTITAYYTRDTLQTTVDQRLAVNPQDTWALNYRSQIMLAQGDTKAAFHLLLNSLELDRDNYDTQFFLVDAMLVGLQQDFSYFSQYVNSLDAIIPPRTAQRSKYLQLMAEGLMRQGDHYAAFQRLWEIMQLRQSDLLAGAQSRAARLQPNENWSVDLDAWLAAELRRNFDACTSDQQTEIRHTVSTEFSKLNATVLTVRRQLLRHMLHLSAADEQNLGLADSLLARNEQTAAEQVLVHLAASSTASTRDHALQLLQRIPEAELPLSHSLPASDQPWPQGMLVRQVSQADDAIYPLGRPVELTGDRFGRPPLTIGISDRLILSDVNGKPVYRLSYRQATSDLMGTQLRAEVRGGLMLLESMSELIAFDYYKAADPNQAILWRFSLDLVSPSEAFRQTRQYDTTIPPLGIQRVSRAKSADRPHAQVGPLLSSAQVIQSGGSVIGLDPYTGRRLWTRDGYGSDIQLVAASKDDLLCIVSPAKRVTEMIDARDGKLVNTNQYLVDEMSDRFRDRSQRNWEPWYSYDQWLVNYVELDEGQVDLRIWSPSAERALLDTRLPAQARVTHCQRNMIIIAIPSGQIQLVDLEAQQIYKYDVPVDQELTSIGAMRFGDRIVLLSSQNAVAYQLPINPTELPVSGYVYSINASSKKLEWIGRLHDQAVPLNQPRTTPLLAMHSASRASQLAILDLRTGKMAYAIEGPRTEQTAFTMEVRPESHELAILVGQKFYRLRQTDEPGPPEPPADYGKTYNVEPQIKRDNSSLFEQ